MNMKTLLRCIVIIAVAYSSSFARAEGYATQMSEIKSMIETMRRSDWGSLGDYLRQFKHDENEFILLNNICEENGWTPINIDPKCSQYSKLFFQNENQPSIFLTWLKRSLPHGDFKGLNSARMYGSGDCTFNRFVVNVGNHTLSFDDEADACPSPGLGLSQIDGKMLNELFGEAVARGDIERLANELGLIPEIPKWDF